MRIALSSDHRGFRATQTVKSHPLKSGHKVIDFGCDSAVSRD